MLSASVEFNSKALLTIGIIFGALVVITGVIYVIKHSQSVKDLPKFINSLEIAIVLTISIIIISICIASIGGIDIYNFNDVYYSIIVPSIMACNIPLYVATVHFLSKLDFYQAI
jgi:heme/copper-type cytochrome/quinol oxidase subunit 2